ncbi:MAG: hypothetical protein V1781_04035 [Bacteroidota bacterium]
MKQLLKKNKVWMMYGWTFQYKNGIQEEKGKKTSFERFDHFGNRTEEIYYDTKGNSSYECSFTYDVNGNELKRMGEQGDEIIYDKWIYAFSDNGKKIEKRSEFKKAREEKWIFVYNENKNKVKETYYDVSGNISYNIELVYDHSNNLVEKKQTDAYGNIFKKWIYKYDAKGYNTEHLYCNNQLFRIYQLRYDKKGNLKSRFTLDANGEVIELTVYIYQFYEGWHAPRTLRQ